MKHQSRLHKSLAISLLTLAFPWLASAQEDFCETLPDGTRPPAVAGDARAGAVPSHLSRQSDGALSGRIVYTCAGHGWTWGGKSGWYTQRGVGHEMNEDYGNLDQMNFFVPYLFNAGATVVAFRPIGYQTNEVVLDNTASAVKFSGQWYTSRSEVYFGKAGATPYRFALLNQTETATAAFTPKIPVTGFYPVYTWVRHGADRTSQLYRILHTGGETWVRVPHHMVGNGWVYLGTYYFDAGSDRKRGSVVVSNLQPSPGFGSVAIADAIRFGNGMGDVIPVPGGHKSTYPREDEASLYWLHKSRGQGQTNLYQLSSGDQGGSNVSAPPRGIREMNRTSAGSIFKRIYIGFHSNAGGGRAAIGLWNKADKFPDTMTPNQLRLADLIGIEVNNTFCAMGPTDLEYPWFIRSRHSYARDDFAFGEINNKVLTNQLDATIIEVAFHDNKEDARMLRDPKVRDISGRCCYQAVVRYMNEFDGVPLDFVPEPPQNLRVTNSAGAITVAWDAPANGFIPSLSNTTVQAYLVYRSDNGYGFGNPVRVSADQTHLTLTDLTSGKEIYFRVTAQNAGGESLPSRVAGCRTATRAGEPRVLFVNGFTQWDRFNNPRQTPKATNYLAPSAMGKMERVIARLNNAFDYAVQHGKALADAGVAFDSCQREGLEKIRLENYAAVIWSAGKQAHHILQQTEQDILADYLNAGGNLFLSGANIAEVLPPIAPASRLPVVAASSPYNSGSTSFAPAKFTWFQPRQSGSFGLGADHGYFTSTVSQFSADGPGLREWLRYSDGTVAGVQFGGQDGGGKVICLGFPFESISAARVRAACMAEAVRIFNLDPTRWIHPQATPRKEGRVITWRTVPGRKYQLQVSTDSAAALWSNLGQPLAATGLSLTHLDPAARQLAHYRVLPSN